MFQPVSPGLNRYVLACRAVAAAKSIDEAKDILDTAEQMRCYAYKAKLRDMELDAADIRAQAEYKLGELVTKHKAVVGFNTGARGIGKPKSAVPEKYGTELVLAEMGIDRKLSSRVQKIAAIPADEFAVALQRWREHTVKRGGRIKPLFQQSAVVPIKLRRPTLQYIQIMTAIDARRIESGLSMEQMSELMGTAERSYAKMLSPDTPSGRLVGWDTIELAISVLWPEGSEIVIKPANGMPAATAGTRRKIKGEQAAWKQRQDARKAARKAVA